MTRAQEEAVRAVEAEEKLGAQSLQPYTIAIGYFKDLSPDNSFRAFQKGLTAMLITDISKIRKLTVVERAKLQSLLEELKLGQTGIVDETSAPRVGKLLKAENIVTGTLNEGSIEVALAVASAGSSGIRGVASAGVEKERFFELPPLIIEKIAEILDIQLSSEEKREIGIPHTRSYRAFMYYGSALDALDRGNWKEAKDLFDRALTEDPQFLLASEGLDSTPGMSAPSIESIKSLNITAIVAAVEKSLKKAFADQDEADKAEELGSGGGGGH